MKTKEEIYAEFDELVRLLKSSNLKNFQLLGEWLGDDAKKEEVSPETKKKWIEKISKMPEEEFKLLAATIGATGKVITVACERIESIRTFTNVLSILEHKNN